jgi:histone-lysine N-methyltransferase SETMAR
VQIDARSGRPSTSRNDELIEQVRHMVIQDRRVTVRELAGEMGISTGSVHSILTNGLALRRVSAKFVPKLIQTFLAKYIIPVVRQAPYSPHVAPYDY